MAKDKDKEKIEPKPLELESGWPLNVGEKAILFQVISEINNAVRARNIAIQSMMAARGLALGDYYIDIEAGMIRRKETANVGNSKPADKTS